MHKLTATDLITHKIKREVERKERRDVGKTGWNGGVEIFLSFPVLHRFSKVFLFLNIYRK